MHNLDKPRICFTQECLLTLLFIYYCNNLSINALGVDNNPWPCEMKSPDLWHTCDIFHRGIFIQKFTEYVCTVYILV